MSDRTRAIPARLSVVTLGARNVAALRAFYRAVGWETSAEVGEEFAAFLLGGVALALYPLELLAAEAAPNAAPPAGGWSGWTLACNVDGRDDVDPVYDAWVAAGATSIAPPVDRDWGGRSGYVADPEGNRWEIAWAPGTAFDARGALTKFGDA